MSNIVIVGSGPAGVSAALYAVRAGVQFSIAARMVLPSSSSQGVVRMAALGFFSRSRATAASSFSWVSFWVRERMMVPAASIWLL